eukprot:TRINITY_DN5761_c0_g1_i1.p1 TRINITY_DN5761_c0_g1~~TRINITY_DN5761_c0_g1_i1.p1  ORF type:complete len:1712 (+),score=398.15 TRINITY_DN5761_c0_g1_i1:668-5137(+)
MTARNNNSSRFGKFLQIMLSTETKKILACSVTDYLLEITRVCNPGAAERNYHIFFQLCVNRNSPELQDLGLQEPKKYTYLKDCLEKAPGIDDKKFFEELVQAFSSLNFDPEMQKGIFKVLAGIMAIGNCEFDPKQDEAKLADAWTGDVVAQLWNLDVGDLLKALTIRKITVGKEVTESPRTPSQAKAARDAFAKLIYGQLFKFLVGEINVKLGDPSAAGQEQQAFGVLDIAGFECFETNSLEQLHINLSNEYLQQHFNEHIFKMEMDDYKKEGIDAGEMQFQDNGDILSLIVSKGGIFTILDEETGLQTGTDQAFVAKLFKAHEKHPRMIKPKFVGATFGIAHFAGNVTYTVANFLEKNLDKPPPEAADLCLASKLKVLQTIGKVLEEASAEPQKKGASKGVKTVSAGFRTQMTMLMDKLHSVQPHYIRCVKPNAAKVAGVFDSKSTLEQLTCSGVMEAVHIRQQGFASRLPFEEFCGRYIFVPSKKLRDQLRALPGKEDGYAKRAAKLVETLPAAISAWGKVAPGGIVLGKTKVFIKSQASALMEKARELGMVAHVKRVQAHFRGFVVRKRMRGITGITGDVKKWMNENNFYGQKGSKYTAIAKLKSLQKIQVAIDAGKEIMDRTSKAPMEIPTAKPMTKTLKRMEEEAATLAHLSGLMTSMEPLEISKALARAAELQLPCEGEVAALTDRGNALKEQLPLHKALKEALEGDDSETLIKVWDAFKVTKLKMHPENWLEELNGAELAGQIFQNLEQAKTEAKRKQIADQAKADMLKNIQQGDKVCSMEVVSLEKEPEPEKRNTRRATITGMGAMEQERIQISLVAAVHENDVPKLKAALAEAVENGVPESDLATAQARFDFLSTEAGVKQVLEEGVAELKAKGRDYESSQIYSLRNLLNHAVENGFAQEEAENAKAVMQGAVRRRAQSTVTGEAFDDMAEDELEMLTGTFANLWEFQGLRPPNKWYGDRSWYSYMRYGGAGQEVMLSHASEPITMALTEMKRKDEKIALEAFRDILGWMCDRHVPAVHRVHLDKAIIEVAFSSVALADEIFLQLMKQLTGNPSNKSLHLGWHLFLRMCQAVTPSADLEGFVRAFILARAIHTDSEDKQANEISAVAKQCIADLNITASPQRVLGEDTERIPLRVSLVDNSTRKIFIKKDALLKDVCEAMAQTLKLQSYKDFSLFQRTESMHTDRLLPGEVSLSMLLAKWGKLHDQTGRSSHLAFKRRYLRVTEELDMNDGTHANLTYRQALQAYYHNPLSEDLNMLADIAATIALSDTDFFTSCIEKNDFSEEGILEHLLPGPVLQEVALGITRPMWSTRIAGALERVRETVVEDEASLVKKQRIVSLLAKRRLSGATFWHGRQEDTLPPGKGSITEAPPLQCFVNQKMKTKADYWVCVDIRGVHFVSTDAVGGGKSFHRGFLFGEESVDRCLHWAAKEDYLTLVVLAMHPDDPNLGRKAQTIYVKAPCAPDIAFFITAMLQDAKGIRK